MESTEEQLSTSEPVSSSIQLTAEEMQNIRGRWKHIAAGAVVGGGFRALDYLRTTCRQRWTWQGIAGAAAWGAIEGGVTMAVGAHFAPKVIRIIRPMPMKRKVPVLRKIPRKHRARDSIGGGISDQTQTLKENKVSVG